MVKNKKRSLPTLQLTICLSKFSIKIKIAMKSISSDLT